MKLPIVLFVVTVLLPAPYATAAEDNIELETTRIKANRELPQILYVVPWKDMESSEETDQKLVLHDFFGDLYEPVLPSDSQQKVAD